MYLKSKREEKSLIEPRQSQTCNHPIYTRTLTGVCQAVRLRRAEPEDLYI